MLIAFHVLMISIFNNDTFVAGFPRAQISVHHKNIHFGSEIKIMSNDLSNPPADKFEWQKSKDGKDFDFIDITKPKYFGSSLTAKSPVLVIPKATFEDKLYYRLVIWNKFGEDVSNTVDVNITGSMIFFKNKTLLLNLFLKNITCSPLQRYDP